MLRCTLLPCASAMHSTRRCLFRAILEVWGENPMGLLSQSTSRVLRIDTSEVRPAWPLPVRDLHPDAAPINADIDFQSGRSRLRASWLGLYSPYSWILEYHVSLYAVNGTQTFLVCPGVAVGLATNARPYPAPILAHALCPSPFCVPCATSTVRAFTPRVAGPHIVSLCFFSRGGGASPPAPAAPLIFLRDFVSKNIGVHQCECLAPKIHQRTESFEFSIRQNNPNGEFSLNLTSHHMPLHHS